MRQVKKQYFKVKFWNWGPVTKLAQPEKCPILLGSQITPPYCTVGFSCVCAGWLHNCTAAAANQKKASSSSLANSANIVVSTVGTTKTPSFR